MVARRRRRVKEELVCRVCHRPRKIFGPPRGRLVETRRFRWKYAKVALCDWCAALMGPRC